MEHTHGICMKGIVVENPNHVCIKYDIPIANITEYECLCRNIEGAVCTGTDLSIITGKNKKISYPCVLGHESVGVVIAAGKKVKNFQIGDLITSPRMLSIPENNYHSYWGGLCEYGIVTDYKSLIEDGFTGNVEMYYCNQLVPEHVDINDAVMSITWSETLAYLDRIFIKNNQKVLLIGSGSVALSFATLLTYYNVAFSVIGSDSFKSRFQHLNLEEYIDYSNINSMSQFRNNTLHYFDCMIDAVGAKDTVTFMFDSLKSNGKLCIYGKGSGDIYQVKGKNQNVKIFDGSYSVMDSYSKIFRMIKERKLSSSSWFDKTYNMEHINTAISDLQNRRAMKALIKIKD